MESNGFEMIFMGGGIWGSSGLWVDSAVSNAIRVASCDSGGYGASLMLSVDGVAAQLKDIPVAFRLIKAGAETFEEQSFIFDLALKEIESRRSGGDKNFSYQKQGKNESIDYSKYQGCVLIALNSSWDSSALGLHDIFDNSSQWIVETIKIILENSKVSVIIRQHPGERLPIAHTSDNYRKLLNKNFGNEPRIHFIAANDPVNSYDLLEWVSYVVVHTSTFGVEAAALGKTVVTPSGAYYSNLGFIKKANNYNEYREYLLSALNESGNLKKYLVEDALLCYYLTQLCYFTFTPFNPEGFSEWSKISLNKIMARNEVQMILRGIQENLPIPYLNHLIKYQNYNNI